MIIHEILDQIIHQILQHSIIMYQVIFWSWYIFIIEFN